MPINNKRRSTRARAANAPPQTLDELKVAIARLSVRIVHETGQSECDRMETELAALQLQLDAMVRTMPSPQPPHGKIRQDAQ